MTYKFSSTNLATLQTLASAQEWSEFYSKVYEFTSDPDDFDVDADPNVREWFRVASEANANIGPSAALIRDYTAAQVAIRTGDTVSEATLDDASNRIAQSVWSNHISLGDLPTLEDIETWDAVGVVEELQFEHPDVGMEVWSGNVLFVGLGSTDPLLTNIIPTSSNSSYNLFAAAESLNIAGIQTLVGAVWNSAFTFAGNLGALNEANNETNAFLSRLYGVLAPVSAQGLFNAQVGRQDSSEDELLGTSGRDAIHASGGDDFIIGSLGADLIDGGSGVDLVSFEMLSSGGQDLSIDTTIFAVSSDVQFSAQVISGSNTDNTSNLFEVEQLTLGVADDVVSWVGDLSSQITSITEINASANDDVGDTIDLSQADGSNIVVDLSAETLVDGNFLLEVSNFENVVGSDTSDSITGNDETNVLVGGVGADSLYGGAGDDQLVFDNDDVSVVGGADIDVAVFDDEDGTEDLIWQPGTNFDVEAVVGGSGNDTLYSSEAGGDMLAGGDGDDVFILPWLSSNDSPTVVWGGGGNDTIKFSMEDYGGWSEVQGSGGIFGGGSDSPFFSHLQWTTGQHEALGIMIVTVDDLTEQNFHLFNTDSLGLNAAFWSEIDLVLLNPDEGDTIQHEMPGGGFSGLPSGYLTMGTETAVDPDGNSYTTVREGTYDSYYDRYVDNYQLSLGGYSGVVQSAGSDIEEFYYEDGEMIEETNYIGYLNGWNGPQNGDPSMLPGGQGAATPTGIGTFQSTDAIGGVNSNWFVVGGEFSDTTISSGGDLINISIGDAGIPSDVRDSISSSSMLSSTDLAVETNQQETFASDSSENMSDTFVFRDASMLGAGPQEIGVDDWVRFQANPDAISTDEAFKDDTLAMHDFMFSENMTPTADDPLLGL
jgi:Ca2+-binding RTX toxin-like protein